MSQFNDVANSPNDKEYADLKTISYHGLFYNEADALNRLYSACTEDGFFYLDLSSPKQEWLHDLVAQLNEASDRFFSRLPLAEKMLYDTDVLGSLKNYGWVQSALFESQGLISSRYKPSGRNSGVVNGKQDGHEMFLMPRDALFKLGPDPPSKPRYPPQLESDVPLLEKFSMECNRIGLIILDCLSKTLDCDPIEWKHDPNEPSTSAAAFLLYPAQPQDVGKTGGHVAHTDVGSLSILFSFRKGLQVFRPGGDRADPEWLYVEPRVGYAVVNVGVYISSRDPDSAIYMYIGDSLRHMSGHEFKSSYHRVIPDQKEARTSVIYFLRPQMDATFTDTNGKEWKSIDYHKMKYNAFRHENPEEVEGILRGDC